MSRLFQRLSIVNLVFLFITPGLALNVVRIPIHHINNHFTVWADCRQIYLLHYAPKRVYFRHVNLSNIKTMFWRSMCLSAIAFISSLRVLCIYVLYDERCVEKIVKFIVIWNSVWPRWDRWPDFRLKLTQLLHVFHVPLLRVVQLYPAYVQPTNLSPVLIQNLMLRKRKPNSLQEVAVAFTTRHTLGGLWLLLILLLLFRQMVRLFLLFFRKNWWETIVELLSALLHNVHYRFSKMERGNLHRSKNPFEISSSS